MYCEQTENIFKKSGYFWKKVSNTIIEGKITHQVEFTPSARKREEKFPPNRTLTIE
jgi:hypothetical protein